MHADLVYNITTLTNSITDNLQIQYPKQIPELSIDQSMYRN